VILTKVPEIIAIDGPAASGKSTLALSLAHRLGYLFFDTGVMYRAVTWAALQRGVEIADEEAVSALAETIQIDVRPPSCQDGRSNDIWVGEEDITWQIRQPEVDANVSPVSAYPRVRRALSAQQRRIGQRGRVVMVGRDIGTVVLPEADLKIYLDASAQERAVRRHHERVGRGEASSLEATLAAIQERDHIDSTRDLSPLRPAEDALILSSDELDAEQVLAQAMALVQRAGEEAGNE
jgi:cytidylate kinase